jgi:UDP-glucose 4-epimerase
MALKKIVITGVNGFIGRHGARHFKSKGFEVYGIDSGPEEHAPMSDLMSYRRTRLPSAALDEVLAETCPAAFVHCAGRASVPLSVSDPKTDFYSGPVLTWEVLDAIRRCSPATRFVFLSSAAVYGTPASLPVAESAPVAPISPYGAHKHQSEIICKEFHDMFGIASASLRIFSAYGAGLQRQVMWDLCHQALTRQSIAAQGTGAESRDFVHVRDICGAIECVLSIAPLAGEVYNLGSGAETSVNELAAMIASALSPGCPVDFSGIVPHGTPLNWCADISRLRELGFRPSVGIEDGVRHYAEWCKAALL